MIGYICKYAPIELFETLGVDTRRIEPQVSNFNQADALMHANMCSYIKAVLEDVMSHDYEGVILTACCDSSRRLYDTLVQQFPDKFFFLLDLPHKVNDFAVGLYEKQLLQLIHSYEAFSGKHFSKTDLHTLLTRRNAASPGFCTSVISQTSVTQNSKTCEVNDSVTTASNPILPLRIGLMGARCSTEIITLLKDHNVDILFDLTCTGLDRRLHTDDEHILNSYSNALLSQIPCMRMIKATNRANFVQGFTDQLDGILYHTVKFCDLYAYEYAAMKQVSDLPILSVETDSTKQCAGQIRTRVEAFIESLQIAKGVSVNNYQTRRRTDKTMNILGIDSGSTSTNAVIINENKQILASAVIRTGAKSGDSADRILDEILQKAKLSREDIAMIVSTGYGRVSIPFADLNVTEISCHGKGAHFLNPEVRTILDIGGQDSKGIRLNEAGEVVDFVMNDKCAAGTGRFLEMMARTLEVSIDELGPISLTSTENIEISSMCSVFAESEVISLIALNKEKSDIAHGIHHAIANKSLSLLKRVGMEPGYMMTGGVAKNPGVVKVLEERLGEKLYIYEEPEIVGALGAALFGLEKIC